MYIIHIKDDAYKTYNYNYKILVTNRHRLILLLYVSNCF